LNPKAKNGIIILIVLLAFCIAVIPAEAKQVNNLKFSDKGINFLKTHEGFPHNNNGLAIMYEDQAGHCTIGYGHLIH